MVNRIGQQAGNYRLIRLLGQGGFADVYLGEHIHLNTQAAIKVLNTQLTSEGTEQFRKEARTIAHLEHPHIVRVLEFGFEQGFPFLVMTYAPNGSLRQHHPKGTQLALHAIVSYIKQVADALQYAHDSRLIHRDVKPENMLLGGRNEVLLSDFGIAVEAHNTLSQTLQEIAGTIPYMAPEQIQGKPCPASDQYALGIVAYEWISGVRPFKGSTVEIAIQQQSTPPPSLRERVPALSPAVEQVVLKALVKDSRQRFASVHEFARVLEQSYQPVEPIHLSLSSNTQPPLHSAPAINVLSSARTLPSLGTTFLTYRGHAAAVSAVAWSPNGAYIVSGSSDGSIQVWDATSGYNIHSMHHARTNVIEDVAWSPDGKYIASATNFEKYIGSVRDSGNVRIWMVKTAKHLFTKQYSYLIDWFEYNQPKVDALAWSPNGVYLATVGAEPKNSLQIWNCIAKQRVLSTADYSDIILPGISTYMNDVAWSPSGTRIATTSYAGTVDIWDAAHGDHIFTYKDEIGGVLAVAWSPEGARIASSSYKGPIRIWNVSSGEDTLTYTGHSDRVESVAWSPNGAYVASASNDGTVQVWQAATGNNLFTYRNHLGAVNALVWSPDSLRIASGSWDSTVQVWQAT